MKLLRLLAATILLFVLGIVAASANAECLSAKDIESINSSVIGKRIAHIKGDEAIAFVLLDPSLSMPEFHDFPYRQEADVAATRRLVEALIRAEIDEVFVWRFKGRRTMGAAVAFADGCAVEEYGEPDSFDKLEAMVKAYKSLASKGPDHPEAKRWVAEVLRSSPFEPTELRVDAILAKVRLYLRR